MIVLADNDVLFKLAQCDLFEEFLKSYDLATQDIRIRKDTRYAVSKSSHRRRIGEGSFGRLTAFLDEVLDIDTAPHPAAIAALTEQTDKNIDVGEAVLFAVCPLIPESIIVTGDKRSLAGLATAALVDQVCARLCEALAGRVLCFEQVLTRILDFLGFDVIRQKLIDGRECDRGLAICLGSGLNTTEAHFREGLMSYLRDARRLSGSLLAE